MEPQTPLNQIISGKRGKIDAEEIKMLGEEGNRIQAIVNSNDINAFSSIVTSEIKRNGLQQDGTTICLLLAMIIINKSTFTNFEINKAAKAIAERLKMKIVGGKVTPKLQRDVKTYVVEDVYDRLLTFWKSKKFLFVNPAEKPRHKNDNNSDTKWGRRFYLSWTGLVSFYSICLHNYENGEEKDTIMPNIYYKDKIMLVHYVDEQYGLTFGKWGNVSYAIDRITQDIITASRAQNTVAMFGNLGTRIQKRISEIYQNKFKSYNVVAYYPIGEMGSVSSYLVDVTLDEPEQFRQYLLRDIDNAGKKGQNSVYIRYDDVQFLDPMECLHNTIKKYVPDSNLDKYLGPINLKNDGRQTTHILYYRALIDVASKVLADKRRIINNCEYWDGLEIKKHVEKFLKNVQFHHKIDNTKFMKFLKDVRNTKLDSPAREKIPQITGYFKDFLKEIGCEQKGNENLDSLVQLPCILNYGSADEAYEMAKEKIIKSMIECFNNMSNVEQLMSKDELASIVKNNDVDDSFLDRFLPKSEKHERSILQDFKNKLKMIGYVDF